MFVVNSYNLHAIGSEGDNRLVIKTAHRGAAADCRRCNNFSLGSKKSSERCDCCNWRKTNHLAHSAVITVIVCVSNSL